jgi:hypothetical protein
MNITTANTHVFAVFWSDERESSEFSLISTNIQSNLSDSSLEHDPPPLLIEINFFLDFHTGNHLSCLTHWSPALKAPSAPSFTKIQVVARNKKLKDVRDTAAAAAVTAATSDRLAWRGTLAAVGLSLLWAAFSPGALAMVARGIKQS